MTLLSELPTWREVVTWIVLAAIGYLVDRRNKNRTAIVETKLDHNTEKTEKTYTAVNGRDESKPENTRGLTGMVEELTATTSSLVDRFDAHEELDNERHHDNLEVQKAGTEATEKLRHKLFGG